MNKNKLVGRPKKEFELTDEQKSFIESFYHKVKVVDMSKKIGVSVRTIYRFLNEKGLSSYDSTKDESIVRKTGKKREVPDGCFDVDVYAKQIQTI